MKLSPMRFKSYVWPHNPRVYEIAFRRDVAAHRVPFGAYTLQELGRRHRVLRGEGEFAGAGAYAEFKKLAKVFYETSPGVLVHPNWDTARAYFVSLWLRQEPTEDYVAYGFEFWECYDGYSAGVTLVQAAPEPEPEAEEAVSEAELEAQRLAAVEAMVAAIEAGSPAAGGQSRTVERGDTLARIAAANGLSLEELILLNPQIRNPNVIYPGDSVRVG